MVPPKKAKRKEQDVPGMPFDDALKRLLNARPQHKTAKKKSTKKRYAK